MKRIEVELAYSLSQTPPLTDVVNDAELLFKCKITLKNLTRLKDNMVSRKLAFEGDKTESAKTWLMAVCNPQNISTCDVITPMRCLFRDTSFWSDCLQVKYMTRVTANPSGHYLDVRGSPQNVKDTISTVKELFEAFDSGNPMVTDTGIVARLLDAMEPAPESVTSQILQLPEGVIHKLSQWVGWREGTDEDESRSTSVSPEPSNIQKKTAIATFSKIALPDTNSTSDPKKKPGKNVNWRKNGATTTPDDSIITIDTTGDRSILEKLGPSSNQQGDERSPLLRFPGAASDSLVKGEAPNESVIVLEDRASSPESRPPSSASENSYAVDVDMKTASSDEDDGIEVIAVNASKRFSPMEVDVPPCCTVSTSKGFNFQESGQGYGEPFIFSASKPADPVASATVAPATKPTKKARKKKKKTQGQSVIDKYRNQQSQSVFANVANRASNSKMAKVTAHSFPSTSTSYIAGQLPSTSAACPVPLLPPPSTLDFPASGAPMLTVPRPTPPVFSSQSFNPGHSAPLFPPCRPQLVPPDPRHPYPMLAHSRPGVPSASGRVVALGASTALSQPISASSNAVPPGGQQDTRKKRPILVDGQNVALYAHRYKMDPALILLAVHFFVKRGHETHVILPRILQDHRTFNRNSNEMNLLEKYIQYTPARRLDGEKQVSHDDLFLLKHATDIGGVVISNDQFRLEAAKYPEFLEVIRKRTLQYTIVGSSFCVAEDPYGRNNQIRLDDVLTFPPGQQAPTKDDLIEELRKLTESPASSAEQTGSETSNQPKAIPQPSKQQNPVKRSGPQAVNLKRAVAQTAPTTPPKIEPSGQKRKTSFIDLTDDDPTESVAPKRTATPQQRKGISNFATGKAGSGAQTAKNRAKRKKLAAKRRLARETAEVLDY